VLYYNQKRGRNKGGTKMSIYELMERYDMTREEVEEVLFS